MKNKILFIAISAIIALKANAEYQIIIQLEPNGIIMEEIPLVGEAKLNPSTINRGESSNLSWAYQYANSVNILDIGTYGKSGSVEVSPLASRNYQIEITKGSQKTIQNAFLTVIQPNPNISFTSSSNRIGIGQPLTLNWNVSNAYGVDIDNGVGNNLPLISSSTVYPTTDTTFKLTAKGYEGVSDLTNYLNVDVVENSVINSFNASSLNVTTGNSVNFSWDVTDSEGLNLSNFGPVSGTPTGFQSVDFNSAGVFDFTLYSTSLNGTVVSSTPININVYNPSVINSYTVNGSSATIDASPNQSLVFDWTSSNSINYTLNGNTVNGNSTTLLADSSVGTTEYILSAFNGAGDSVSRSLSVNVVGLPTINTFNAPTAVFINNPFNLSWTGTGISKYEIKSDNSNSGVATTAFDLGSSLNTNATPTVAGTYNYTLSAYNTANSKIDSIKSVIVEAKPTFTGFTVNGATSVTVAPNSTLTYASSGFSSGATFAARNSDNSAAATNPTIAPTTAGTYIYYGAATKTLNSVTEYSALRAVSVTVVNAPTIGTITAPSNVFANAAFTMSWTGTNAVNYKIRGNVAASGISTTDVDLGTSLSSSITPTAAGTYTYTITATNAAGVTTTSTDTVIVEANPTFTGFTVNGGTTINVGPTGTLTYASIGFSAGSTFVTRNSENNANATNPTKAPATVGTYTYYAAATKTLNSTTRYSALIAVVVNVVETWVATTPTYTTWVNNGAISCSSWTPDPSTIASGTSFEQSQTCNQAQTRNRQERQIETTTGAIRNVGSAIVESQTITTIPKRTATGTKVNKVCLFDQSFNPNHYFWTTFTGGQSFWISGYGSIPTMTIDPNTGMGVDFGYGSYPVVGLTKISLTEFTYAAPDKTWRITRGDYVNNTNGNNNYKICVE